MNNGWLTGGTVVAVGAGPVLGGFFFVFFLGGRLEFPLNLTHIINLKYNTRTNNVYSTRDENRRRPSGVQNVENY